MSLTEAPFLPSLPPSLPPSPSLFLFFLPFCPLGSPHELHSPCPCPCCVPNRAHTGFLCFAEIHEPRRTCRFRGSFVRSCVLCLVCHAAALSARLLLDFCALANICARTSPGSQFHRSSVSLFLGIICNYASMGKRGRVSKRWISFSLFSEGS